MKRKLFRKLVEIFLTAAGLTIVLGLDSIFAQSPSGMSSAALEELLEIKVDSAHNVDLSVNTGRGYLYTLEKTATLATGTWAQTGSDIYGVGQQVLMRVHTPVTPPAGSTPSAPPITNYTFHLVGITAGTTLLHWSEGSSQYSEIVNLPLPNDPSPIWQQRIDVAPPGDDSNDYQLTISMLSVHYAAQSAPPTNPPPTTGVLDKITSVWSQLDGTLSSNSGGSNVAVSGDINLYRAVVSAPDSDGDLLPDWLEFGTDPNSIFSSPFMTDSDGDGYDDYTEYLNGTNPGDYRSRPFDSAHPPAVADLWVDGSYSGIFPSDGSSDLPFSTIEAAVNAANEGDVIGVRQGVYQVNVDNPPPFTSDNLDIKKSMKIVAVDGPEKTLIHFFNDEAGQLVRISNPTFKGGIYDGNLHDWSHGMAAIGRMEGLIDDPVTVEIHGFRIVEGFKAPTFFVLPGSRLVLSNCYLASLICGVAECHSSELYLLNCQVSENADLSRKGDVAGLPPGIVYLRGTAHAEVWQSTLVDNVKEEGYGTIHMEDASTVKIVNSVLWESNNYSLSEGGWPWHTDEDIQIATDPRRSRVLTISYPSPTPANYRYDATKLDPTDEDHDGLYERIDVQSSILFTVASPASTTAAFPHPVGGVSNHNYVSQGFYLLDEGYVGTSGNLVADLRTRYLSYEENEPEGTQFMDGVKSSALDTSTGSVGPLGYRHLLKYDLAGRSRQETYRATTPLLPPITPVDIGAVEVVPTLRDSTTDRQRPWTDIAAVSLDTDTAPALVATGPYVDDQGFSPTVLNPGQLFVISNTTNASSRYSFEQESLALDGAQENSLIAACAFDTSSRKFYSFGDMRRGGRPAYSLSSDADILSRSMHLGCGDISGDALLACTHTDYFEPALRASFLTVPANPLGSIGSTTLRKTPETVSLDTMLASGNIADSPSAYQESAGLRAAIKAQLLALDNANGNTFESCLKPVDGYPSGFVIAFNDVPKFGAPENGTLPTLNSELSYSGGGPEDEAGLVIHVATGSSTSEQTFSFDASAYQNLQSGKRSELFFRAWPYRQTAGGPVFGPAFDASIVQDGKENYLGGELVLGNGTLDPQPFPLVINEVMSGATGWVEIFNTWGTAYTAPSGTWLKVHQTSERTSTVTAQVNLSGVTIPARGLKVAARFPGAGELQLVNPGGGAAIINDSGNARFEVPSSPVFDDSESFVGRDRLDNAISEGRAWDGGPRGENTELGPDEENQGAAFLSGASGLQKSSRGNSNTANYMDTFSSATVRQPYFQATSDQDGDTIWLSWRNVGYLGAVWDGDGLRHDFASVRVEGTAVNGGTIIAGLRAPLSQRSNGSAVLMSVSSSSVDSQGAGGADAWGTVTATRIELNLGGQGVRAVQWCPHVDGTGKYLIISGPPTTDDSKDHPSVAVFSLWSWDGTASEATVRIRDLAPFAKRPSGVATFKMPNIAEPRIVFSENETSPLGTFRGSEIPLNAETNHILHWPISILD